MDELGKSNSKGTRNQTLPEIIEDLKKLLNWKMSVKEKESIYDGKLENGLSGTRRIAELTEEQLLKDINKLDSKTKNMLMTMIVRIYSYLQNMENTTEDSQYTLREMMDDLIRLSKWESIINKKESTGEDGLLATREIAKREEEQLVKNIKRLNPSATEVLKTMIGKIYNFLQPKKEEHDER